MRALRGRSQNWVPLLFGSLDPRNFISVDKPPVSQWVMALSGQIFGFSSASMLIPQALMAVASVALLYGAVRRISGPSARLLAAATLALTPVAALMFRFNNPDAAMVLLMVASAYCTVRALEHASARWIALAGVALGFAFLAKMLEGLMARWRRSRCRRAGSSCSHWSGRRRRGRTSPARPITTS
jgi:4-amino-4-deoxy-L-arabinose transferase-like glycosyltransferase